MEIEVDKLPGYNLQAVQWLILAIDTITKGGTIFMSTLLCLGMIGAAVYSLNVFGAAVCSIKKDKTVYSPDSKDGQEEMGYIEIPGDNTGQAQNSVQPQEEEEEAESNQATGEEDKELIKYIETVDTKTVCSNSSVKSEIRATGFLKREEDPITLEINNPTNLGFQRAISTSANEIIKEGSDSSCRVQ